jgi:integrase
MAKVPRTKSVRTVPHVRLAVPKNRPIQLRYYCPEAKREIRMSTGTRDLEAAEQQKAELEARLLLGLPTQTVAKTPAGPEMDWSDFRELYRTLHLVAVRDSTAAAAESRLDLAERILKPKTLADVAATSALQKLQAEMLAGRETRRKKPRSPHTVRGHMGGVLGALNWAYLQDWLPTPPKVRKLKVSKSKAMKGRPITEQEFKKMLEATDGVVGADAAHSWRYLLRGLWESALRLSELMNVSWNLAGTIRPVWAESRLPLLDIPASMQKNDTEQSIPLLPAFEDLLNEIPTEDRKGWVFEPLSLQLQLGRRIQVDRPSSEWVGKIVSRIGKAAGIIVEEADERTGRPVKHASAHDLRRSCGERLRNAGVPPLVICRVMRHESWETTRKHYAPGDVQQDAQVLRETLRQT